MAASRGSGDSGDLTSLFTELNKAINVTDYKLALKISNKIIHTKEGNTDEKAMHCKVVSMIFLNQFAEALKFIQSMPAIDSALTFEKAYCQYRLLETDKALETINDCPELDVRLTELKAQVLFKLGYYQESFELYKRLMKDCADDYDEERKTNLFAALSSISLWKNEKAPDLDLQLTSYEQMYNKACKLLGEGRAAEGETLLQEALKECKEFYEDDPDMTEEEIEAELAVMKVQMGYALQLQGRDDEALAIYNQVIRSRPDDIGLLALASNNIITINKDQNVFDSKKKMKATLVSGVQQKLVTKQLHVIELNRALLYMYSNQWDPCRKLLKTLQRENKDTYVPCLIQAAQLCREKSLDKAVVFLQDFLETHSDPDLYTMDLTHVKITLVQLLLGQGRVERACELLESMEDIRQTPGVLSLLVSLHDSRKDGKQKACQILDRAIDWHKKHDSPRKTLLVLMWECSQYKLKCNQPKQAAEVLEGMRKLNPQDIKVLAQLIFAYSHFSPSEAHKISKDLPSMEQLSVSVDVDYLEKNSLSLLAPRYVKRQTKQKQAKPVPESEQRSENKKAAKQHKETISEVKMDFVVKAAKKKRKKKRLPQNYDANAEPDPERWIPLRERSYYKGRRKDRKKGVGKGTQGSAMLSSENLDMSAKPSGGSTPASPKPGTATVPNPTVSSPKPSATRPKGKQAMKVRKKKGKSGW